MSLLRAISVILFVAAPATAEERLHFDAYLSGIKGGELEIAASIGRNAFALAGRAESTGLMSLIRKVRYDADVRGRIAGDRFTPERYAERTISGDRRKAAEMPYRAGVPQKKIYNPPRPPEPMLLDPATQGGTVDPLTALYLALRDVDKTEACSVSVRTFDGERAGRLDVSPDDADPLVCRGAFTRVAGYTEEELAEARSFPFTIHLAPGDGSRLKVTRVEIRSLYGRMRLVRR